MLFFFVCVFKVITRQKIQLSRQAFGLANLPRALSPSLRDIRASGGDVKYPVYTAEPLRADDGGFLTMRVCVGLYLHTVDLVCLVFSPVPFVEFYPLLWLTVFLFDNPLLLRMCFCTCWASRAQCSCDQASEVVTEASTEKTVTALFMVWILSSQALCKS